MAATNLMGRGIAVKTIKAILDMFPNIITSQETNAEKIAKCIKVKGVAEKTCRPFVENIPNPLSSTLSPLLSAFLISFKIILVNFSKSFFKKLG